MEDDTTPSAPAPGSVSSDAPMSLDDAANAYTFDDEDDAAAMNAEAVEGDSETDDFAIVEGEEEAETQQEAEQAERLASEDMLVEVDGEKIPVAELKKSRLLEADYTRNKQVLAQERQQLQELGNNFNGALERVVNYLAAKLPNEPDPQLAFTNPGLHYQQRQMYDAALAEMQGILGLRNGVEQANQYIDETKFKALVSEENQNLVQKMPHLKDPKRLDAFNRVVTEGAKSLGFSEQEINSTADHRIRLLAYHAARGMKAQAEAAKAKAKVSEAKPMLPVQNRKQASEVDSRIVNAQRRFDKNPSPENAAALLAFSG